MRLAFVAGVATVALSGTSHTAFAQSVIANEAPPPATDGRPSADPNAVDPAQAQVTEPAVANVPAEQGGLEDIIVTATRRSENLQVVPVAISALPASQLQNAGVFETSDLNGKLPNLQVSSPYGKQQPNFSVRGVGVGTEFNANAASPVGVYVDEVYQAFRSSHGQQLYDLNQIEVVRGPQGTLYGRNTTGGAINFITRAPELNGQNGYATVGYASFERFSAEGAVEVTPIEDVLGIRLAFTAEDSEPYLRNVLPRGVNRAAANGASGLNFNTGLSPGGAKSFGLRGTIRFKPNDRIDLSLKAYAGESDGVAEAPLAFGQSKTSDVIDYTSPNFLLGGLFAALAPAGLVPASYSDDANGLGEREINQGSLGRALSNAAGVVFNAKFKLSDDLRLVSITGYDDGRYLQQSTDCDATPLFLCAQKYESKFQSFNQDVRLDLSTGRLKLIVGGYYGRDDLLTDNGQDFFNFLRDVNAAVGSPRGYFNPGGAFNGAGLSAGSLPTGITGRQRFRQRRTSYAGYGEGSFELTDTIKITLGGRYTIDRNRFYDGITTYFDDTGAARLITVSDFRQNGAFSPYFLQPVFNEAGAQVIPSFQALGIPLPGGLENVGKSNRFSGRAIVDWRPTDTTLLYGSFSRGYRAGTYNGLAYASANQVYFVPPETVNAYEAGFKTRFLNNRVQFNGAFFYYDYKGQQGQVVDQTATANLVSLDGNLKGVELDLQVAATDTLQIGASFGYLDSEYDSGACPATPVFGFPAQQGNCVLSSGGNVDVGGNPFPYAADYSATGNIDWNVPVGSGKLLMHVDANYTGQFYYDAFKDYSRGPLPNVTTGQFTEGEGKYVIVNARVAYTFGNYTLAGYVKNATDKLYYPFGIALENLFGNDYRVRAQPRTFGGELSVRF